MFRMNKLTDYGFVLLTHMAARPRREWSARELALGVKLPLPTVVKIAKTLVRGGLLTSQRGVKGGYALARPASEVTAASIIFAFEGPVSLTECHEPGACEREAACPTRPNWQVVNRTVQEALEKLTLAELVEPLAAPRWSLLPVGQGRLPVNTKEQRSAVP